MARNKKHKSKFASKGEIARKAQGRTTEKKTVAAGVARKALITKGGQSAGTKGRKQQVANALKTAKNEAVSKHQTIGTRRGPPRIVGVVAVNESANALALQAAIVRVSGSDAKSSEPGVPLNITCPAVKQRFTLVADADADEQRIADIAKVSDVMVLAIDCSAAVQQTLVDVRREMMEAAADDDDASVMSGSTWFNDVGLCITDTTREIIANINNQGAPTMIVVLQGLDSYDHPKRRRQSVKLHERYFRSVLSKEARVVVADSDDELFQLLRLIATIKMRALKWRDQRPYMVVDNGDYNAETRELQLSGFVRGSALSADQLFHVTNHGTYKIKSIAAPGDPCLLRADPNELCGELDTPGSEQESLQCIQDVDPAYDEGFPTEEDVAAATEDQQRSIRVPAGVSEYQAAWYDLGSLGDELIEHSEPLAGSSKPEFDNMSRATAQTDVEKYLKASDVLRHDAMTDEERRAELEQLQEDCEDEERHADEVFTPFDLPARQRFSKYRGMRTEAWNPKENLPEDYARVFSLHGYGQIRDAAFAEQERAPVAVGTYVTVTLSDVEPSLWETADKLLIGSGQLRHEQKWSVLHFHVQRNSDYEDPIKSKTMMLVHVGFRKMYCAPLFSDVTVGKQTKFARYFLPGDKFRIASFYGPISYHACPILMFKAPSLEEAKENVPMPLCCFGAAMPPNPDMLILKRVVLSGRMAVIYKKMVVIKFMFYNDDDVRWFQPVELRTKLGRRGKIIKAVGSHGLFKATFSDTVMQHDMPMMDIFKRMYPKWKTVMYDVAQELTEGSVGVDGVDDDDEDVEA
jgi:pre-rRNA-processing protein TSR1